MWKMDWVGEQEWRKGDQLGSHAVVQVRDEDGQGKKSAGEETNMQYILEENAITELGDVLI